MAFGGDTRSAAVALDNVAMLRGIRGAVVERGSADLIALSVAVVAAADQGPSVPVVAAVV